mmetsp:Transcript_15367/g.31391  ORF Transcript_15367/g.31391 Transcript_15367/m.31391 type:complete len:89 (-) Transcript_15367:569-835(-)
MEYISRLLLTKGTTQQTKLTNATTTYDPGPVAIHTNPPTKHNVTNTVPVTEHTPANLICVAVSPEGPLATTTVRLLPSIPLPHIFCIE